MTMRIMGLDYGSKTVGVAVSDPLGITDSGSGDYMQKGREQAQKDLCAYRSTDRRVSGYEDCPRTSEAYEQ